MPSAAKRNCTGGEDEKTFSTYSCWWIKIRAYTDQAVPVYSR